MKILLLCQVWNCHFNKKSCQNNINALQLEKPAHSSPCLKNKLFEDHSYVKAIKKYLLKKRSKVGILIGYDYVSSMAPMSYLKHPNEPHNCPKASETSLGWYVFGLN